MIDPWADTPEAVARRASQPAPPSPPYRRRSVGRQSWRSLTPAQRRDVLDRESRDAQKGR